MPLKGILLKKKEREKTQQPPPRPPSPAPKTSWTRKAKGSSELCEGGERLVQQFHWSYFEEVQGEKHSLPFP